MQPASNIPFHPSFPLSDDRAVWIDHSHARVGGSADGRFSFVEVASAGESVPKGDHSGGMPLPSHVGGNRGLHPERQHEEHLKVFYDEVIGHLKGAKRVLVLGPLPGAPQELEKRMRDHANLKGVEIRTEAASKLTDHEIAERLRTMGRA